MNAPEFPAVARTRARSVAGFTLIELMVVIVIIGVLATIGSANYVRVRESTKRAACLEQQRTLRTAAQVYANDQGLQNGVISVNSMIASGLLGAGQAECPASQVDDNDDYSIELVDGGVVEITCTYRGPDHALN